MMARSDTVPLLRLHVSGIPHDVEKEDIEFYFSKQKCGGGEANVSKFHNGKAVVSIRHLDNNAQQELLKMTHKLGGEVVTVTKYIDPTSKSSQCTVIMKGFTYSNEEFAKEVLELHFTNDIHGGGEITDGGIVFIKGKALVTFMDSKVAEKVVKNSPHPVVGQVVEVELAKEEPSNLLLKNVPPGTDIEFVELYMDSVTGLSSSDGDYEILKKSESLYLVIFKSTSGLKIDEIIDKISKKKIKKQHIEAVKIVPSTSLVVSNIIENKNNEEFLKLYFTNPKYSGASELDDIEMLDDGRVIVHLYDQNSVQAVLKMEHTRLGPKVDLQLYDRFSSDDHGSSLLQEVDLKDHTPAIPVRRKVSHVMAQFVQQHQSSLCRLLEQLYVQISVEISEVSFIHLLPSKGSEGVENWNTNCEAKLELFFKDHGDRSVQVYPQLLPKLQETVSDAKSLYYEYSKDHTILHVAGSHDDISKLVAKISQLEEMELAKEETISVEKKRGTYICQTQMKRLQEDHPDVIIEIRTEESEHEIFSVVGKKADLEAFKQSIDKIKCVSSPVLVPKVIEHYLSSSDDKEIINNLLQEKDTTAALYYDEVENTLFVLASERTAANRLAKHLKQVIDYGVIGNANLVCKMYNDQQFSAFCKQLKRDCNVDIVISPTEIEVVGDRQHVNSVMQKLNWYIQKECSGKQRIKISVAQWRFILEHLTSQWNKITHKLETDPQYQDVEAQFPKVTDDDPVILLKGEESLITSLFQQITTLVDSICTNDPPLTINRPGLSQYLATPEAKISIRGIEVSTPACVVCTLGPLEHTASSIIPYVTTSSASAQNNHKEQLHDAAMTDNGSAVSAPAQPAPVASSIHSASVASSIHSAPVASSIHSAPVASSIHSAPIILLKGKLLEEKADVYVNTTTSDLMLNNGEVSKSILKAAGQTIQDECSQFVSKNGKVQPGGIAVTGPGKIPCKHIIHTAGSNYDSSNSLKSEKVLEEIVQKSLTFCDKNGITSIAFPALGAGGLKFPPDVVARVMITTVQNYYQANSSGIKAVKFVIFMPSTHKKFQRFLSQYSGPTSSSYTASPSPQPVPSPQSVHMPNTYQPPPSSFTSPQSKDMSEMFKTGSITVEVVCGDITDDNSDVIVNITFSDLQLTSTTVSKAISKKAGPSMQQDCQKYINQHKQLEEGKVCITQATGQLQCKKVFHVLAPDANKANALSLLVTTCLKEAECKQAVSIAFPAIGTGGLSFNPSDVAKDMCAKIIEFASPQPVFLQQVKIVVYQRDMHKVFLQKFIDISARQTGPNLLIRCTDSSLKVPQHLHSLSSLPTVYASSATSSYQSSFLSPQSGDMFKTGNITVKVVSGDITDDDSDVIVSTATPGLQLASNAVSNAISQKAGPSMQQDCQKYINQHKQLEEGKVCITQATGRLKCKKVFHVVVPNGKEASIVVNLLVTTCLKEAECNKTVSIAFPAIGTGGNSYNPSDVAQDMCAAIIRYASQSVFLQQVKVVVFEKDMLKIFVQKFFDISSRQTGQYQSNLLIQGSVNSVGNYLSSQGSTNKSDTRNHDYYSVVSRSVASTQPQSVTVQPTSNSTSSSIGSAQFSSAQIRVYAKTTNDVTTAVQQLLEIFDQNCESLAVVDPRIATLRPDQMSRLTQKAKDNHVSIELETELSQIELRGGRSNVQIVKSEVHNVLLELDIEKSKRETTLTAASLIQIHVTWQYLTEDNQYKDCDLFQNYEIEQAYQLYKKESQNLNFLYEFNGVQYHIAFDEDFIHGRVKDCSNGKVTDIKRLESAESIKTVDEYPSTWGNDAIKDFQTKLVQLRTGDSEYIEVKKGFESTASGYTIVKIERIQNPSLYILYADSKRLMDQTNPPGTTNERRLYHGCGGDVVEDIYEIGFNRSFCGKNGTSYGRGVYFAVNASYSVGYTSTNASGNRHMFWVRVLTGEYTKGCSSYIQPPKKPSKSKTVLYDSVVDNTSSPNMFVVFHDTQCYPEYLITFK